MASVPFNNLITFSRGSNATVTGPTGLVQWAPNNLLTFSEQFNNAAWTTEGGSITANSSTAPDGTATAELFTENTANAVHRPAYQSPTTTSAEHTFSVYLKYVSRQWVYLRTKDSSNTNRFAWFDIQNGVIGTVQTNLTASITNAGNGWYRCSITVSSAFAGTNLAMIGTAATDNTEVYTGNGTSGILIWGAQLELGSAATTYNSTTVKNLLGFSEAFDNAAWNKANASIVTGAQANPVNGAFNAQKLMENATGSTDHPAYTNAITAIVGTTYVISFYIKAAGRNWAAVGNFDGSWRQAYFDLVNGVVGTVAAGITAQMVSVGSGWYRCSVTRVMASTSIFAGVWTASANGTITYTGDGNSGVYIYGAQLSDSASLDPYVPTPAAAPSSTAYYGPRFDYDPVTLAPKGLLVEEARTNLLLRSAEFDNASWTKSAGSITATTAAAPDGTNTADTFTTTGDGFVTQGVSASANTAYTGSVWLRVTTGTRSVSLFRNDNGTGFSTTSVTVTTTWQRFTLTATSSATATVISFQIGGGGSLPNGSTIEIWGAQLEAGAFATSYIPTVASTVTRSADVATINGSLFSQWYGQTEGTFVAGFDMAGGSAAFANNRAILVARESATSSHNIYNGSGQVTGWTVVSGVDQAFLTTGALAADTATNMAYAYKANDFAASRNGGTVATDTSGTLPSPTVLGICSNSANSLFLSGHIRSIDYIPTRIADFQLQALTELPLVPTLDLDFLNNLYEA